MTLHMCQQVEAAEMACGHNQALGAAYQEVVKTHELNTSQQLARIHAWGTNGASVGFPDASKVLQGQGLNLLGFQFRERSSEVLLGDATMAAVHPASQTTQQATQSGHRHQW